MLHQGVPKLNPELIPPTGAEPAGVTPDGKHQLYRMTRRRAVIQDKVGPDGEKEYRKNTITGEQLWPVRKVNGIEEVEELFYLESEGNGNVRKVRFRPLTNEEQKAIARREAVEAFMRRLAEEAVDRGLTPEEVLARGQEIAQEQPEPDEGPLPEPGPAAEGGAPAGETEPPRRTVWDFTVRDLKEVVPDMDDPQVLADWYQAETRNPDHEGGRSSVLGLLKDRMEDLLGDEGADAQVEAKTNAEVTPEL